MKSLIEFLKKKIFYKDIKFFGGILDQKVINLPRTELSYIYEKPPTHLICYQGNRVIYRQDPFPSVILYERWKLTPLSGGTSHYVFVPAELTYKEIKILLGTNGMGQYDINFRY